MRSTTRVVSMLVCALMARSAAADAVSDMDLATRQLKEAQHEEAIVVLSRAVDRGDATAEQRAGLYALLGIARHELRDDEGARVAFRRALEADLDVPLPRIASPKTRSLFESVKKQFVADRVQFAPAPTAGTPRAGTLDESRAALPPTAANVPVTPATEVNRPAAGRSRSRLIAELSVAAAGCAIGGPGIFLMVDARTRRAQAAANPDAMTAANLYSSAYSENVVGIGMGIAGGATLAVAAVIAIWPASDTPVAVGVGPSGIRVSARFP